MNRVLQLKSLGMDSVEVAKELNVTRDYVVRVAREAGQPFQDVRCTCLSCGKVRCTKHIRTCADCRRDRDDSGQYQTWGTLYEADIPESIQERVYGNG